VAELVKQLLEHERQECAQMLRQKQMIEENVWSHPRLALSWTRKKSRGWR
jgi:hypothetical protein